MEDDAMEVSLSPGDFVLDGDLAPYPKRCGSSPTQFSAHVYCGQTAAWIKMPLGSVVGLGLRHIVFDVDPATARKKAHPPHSIFGPCLLWPNGWMDEDVAWYGSRPCHWPRCTRGGPSSRERGTAAHHLFAVFGPCLLWPRSPIFATAELLLGFGATVYKTVRPSYRKFGTLPVLSIAVLSVCLHVTLVYCGQTIGWI